MSESSNTLPEQLRPLGKRVLVRQKSFTNKLASGLFIPQDHRMGYEDHAKVIALGPKATVDVKVGDTVIFKRQPAAQINPDGKLVTKEWDDFLLLDEANILAIVEDDQGSVTASS